MCPCCCQKHNGTSLGSLEPLVLFINVTPIFLWCSQCSWRRAVWANRCWRVFNGGWCGWFCQANPGGFAIHAWKKNRPFGSQGKVPCFATIKCPKSLIRGYTLLTSPITALWSQGVYRLIGPHSCANLQQPLFSIFLHTRTVGLLERVFISQNVEIFKFTGAQNAGTCTFRWFRF